MLSVRTERSRLLRLGVGLLVTSALAAACGRSRRSITLRPQTDGQIRRIFARPADAVRAGAVIMQIDPARHEASLRSQEAARVAAARAGTADAEGSDA